VDSRSGSLAVWQQAFCMSGAGNPQDSVAGEKSSKGRTSERGRRSGCFAKF
jgi:hypothetical protein